MPLTWMIPGLLQSVPDGDSPPEMGGEKCENVHLADTSWF